MEKPAQSTSYLKYFIIVVIFAAAISLVFKGYSLIKSSTFKHETFNLLIIDREAHLIHLNTTENKLIRVDIKDGRREFLNETQITQSAKLGVLIDGVIILPAGIVFGDNDFIAFSDTLDFLFLENGLRRVNINEFDVLKIYLVSKKIPQKNRTTKKIDIAASSLLSESNDSENFLDSQILEEKASVRIINATDIDGLGNSFSRALKKIGYNVVDLETSDKQNTKIYANKDFPASYFRIIDSLRINGKKEDSNQIADITIIIGPDILK